MSNKETMDFFMGPEDEAGIPFEDFAELRERQASALHVRHLLLMGN